MVKVGRQATSNHHALGKKLKLGRINRLVAPGPDCWQQVPG